LDSSYKVGSRENFPTNNIWNTSQPNTTIKPTFMRYERFLAGVVEFEVLEIDTNHEAHFFCLFGSWYGW